MQDPVFMGLLVLWLDLPFLQHARVAFFEQNMGFIYMTTQRDRRAFAVLYYWVQFAFGPSVYWGLSAY